MTYEKLSLYKVNKNIDKNVKINFLRMLEIHQRLAKIYYKLFKKTAASH